MALESQIVPISLGQGVDSKTDPKQLPVGQVSSLQNAVFSTLKEYKKRNGGIAKSQSVVGHSDIAAGSTVAAYSSELTMTDGSQLYSYAPTQGSWMDIGRLQATSLSTSEVYRDLYQQTLCDSAINGNYQCNVWHSSNSSTPVQYSVVDLQTGVVRWSNSFGSTTTKARVFTLGNYFIILSYNSSGTHLNYTYLDTTVGFSGATVSINTDINSTTPTFDGIVINGKLYIVYNSSSARISLYTLTSGLVLSAQVNEGSQNCLGLGLASDASNNIWVFYSTSTKVRGFVMNSSLVQQLAPTDIATVNSAIHLTGYVSGTTAHVFFDFVNSDTKSFIQVGTLTLAGSGSGGATINSVSLYSKGFSYNSTFYFWAQFNDNEQIQQTYFLIDENGYVVAKLAPGNGSTPDSTNYFLASTNLVSTGVYQVNYLFKERLDSVNGNVFATTGVNSCSVTMNPTALPKVQAGNNLLLGGGLVNMYDGKNAVEFGFNYFPDVSATAPVRSTGAAIGPGASTSSVNSWQYCATYEWSDNQGQIHRSAPSIQTTVQIASNGPVEFTATVTTGSANLTSVSPTAGLAVGMHVQCIQSVSSGPPWFVSFWTFNTTITAISGTTVTVADAAGTVAGSPASGVSFLATRNPVCLMRATYQLNSKTPIAFVTTGLSPHVGMAVIPTSANAAVIASGTYLTNSSTGELSQPATADATLPCLFYSGDVYQYVVTVPTLRLTNKQFIAIVLYRTVANGTVFYRVSSITSPNFNATGSDSITITDTTPDNTLIGNDQLYTNGGEVENIAPPACFALASEKGRTLLLPNEDLLSYWYTKQVLSQTPVEFSDLFVGRVDERGGNLTAIGVLDEKIILFKASNIFYVVGDGPSPSGANNDFTTPQLISSDCGCITQASVITMPNGIMFQSQKGIYLLDRSLATTYIGAPVEAYNSQTVTSVQKLPNSTMIRFTLNSQTVLMYDWFVNEWSVDAFPAQIIDSTIWQSKYATLNSSGQVVVEDSSTYTDNSAFIPLSLGTGWMNFAQIQGFQRVKQLLIVGNYKSPHDLVVTIYTDFSDVASQTVTIPVQTDPGVYQFRVFINQQKCEAIKISITDSNTSGTGESFSLSALTLEVGVKRGLNKLPASASYS